MNQPPIGVPRKRCSENMQQIYRRTSIPKCDFNKVALLCNFIEITLRHGCFPVNLLHIFRTPFLLSEHQMSLGHPMDVRTSCKRPLDVQRSLMPTGLRTPLCGCFWQKLLYEVLHWLNHEEYIQKIWTDPKEQYPQNFLSRNFFQFSISLNKTWFEL